MREFAGQQFSGFKNALADLAVAKLAPIADEMRRLMADTGGDRPHPERWRARRRARSPNRSWKT